MWRNHGCLLPVSFSLTLDLTLQMTLLKGHVAVRGRLAYVAQQAWILNATLRDNILFGQEFQKDR